MSMSLGLIALLAALQAAPVPPAQDATQLDDIIVEGRPLDETVEAFVGEIARPARGRGLARWNGSLCVGVVNLQADYAQPMIDRISDVADAVGVRVGAPGCTPRVVIIATDDGAALAKALVADQRDQFDVGSTQTDAGPRALWAFQNSDRAVRWWQTSVPVDSDTGQRAIRLAGDIDPSTGEPSAPTINVNSPSRLRSQIRDDLSRVVVIVDMTRLDGTTFEQLTDYLALVVLAQIDAEAQTSDYDTILNLFGGAGAPARLTQWDMGYLEALYSSQPQRLNPNSLTAAVASDVASSIRADAQASED